MKTFKLKRQYCNKPAIWEDIRENEWNEMDWQYAGRDILCGKFINKLFHINKKAKTLWVKVRKTPAKGFYKATRTFHGDYGFVEIKLDGKRYETYSLVEEVLDALGCKTEQDFYFSMEYSMD